MCPTLPNGKLDGQQASESQPEDERGPSGKRGPLGGLKRETLHPVPTLSLRQLDAGCILTAGSAGPPLRPGHSLGCVITLGHPLPAPTCCNCRP